MFNNIGNRKQKRIQILLLQVMQQGTQANLCKLPHLACSFRFPFRSHFVREKFRRERGEGGGERGEGGGGRGEGGGRREARDK